MIRLPIVLLLSILVPSALAQDARVFEVHAPPAGALPVIVEFRDAPLFARSRGRVAGDARETLEQRFAAFESDLAAIDRELARGGVAAAGTATVMTQRYSRVFAGAALTVPLDAIARIRNLEYVRAVHLDRPVQALLDASVPKIRGRHVWASFGTRGRGVVVAVIDTGIDYRHAAFDSGFGAGHRVAGGWDFVNDDPDPLDDDGHGTHVAGIVAGRGGDVIGVAPDATLLAYKVLDRGGDGMASTVVAGIERAADPDQDGNPDDHAHVVNLSLGAPSGGAPDDPMSRAVETATAAGMIFCIGAGNESFFQTVRSPGVATSAITVGASTIVDTLASFSSKGPVVQNFGLKPEVVAPGEGIVSALLGGGRTSKSGTSMATPHVAGVAALLRAIHPDWTPAAVKAAIVGTAVPLGYEAMAEGAGRVDALNAATADVIALQGVLSLGATDGAAARYTPSATVTLVNRGTVARTLIVKAPSPREGITVTPDARGFVLEPGATKDVHVAFDVDNAKVPAPAFGSLAYSGAIQITGGAVPLRVPWAFVKGAPVTLDYDGDEPYTAFLHPTGAGYPLQITAGAMQHRVQRLVPAATYDVVAFPSAGDRQRVIVLEQQGVSGTATTIALRREAAIHELDLRAEDEHGAPLGNGRDCTDALVVLAPPSSPPEVFATYSKVPFLISAVSERFTLAPFTLCIAPGPTLHSGQFEPLRGIASPRSLLIRADEWSRTPLVVKAPPGGSQPGYDYAAGWSWNSSSGSSFGGLGRFGPLRDSGWQSTLFLTPMRDPAIRASGKVAARRTLQADPLPTTLESPAVQRSPEGIVMGGALTASPVTYVAKPGEAVTFGEGPMFVRLTLGMAEYYSHFGLSFIGALGEDRRGVSTGTSVVIRNSAGVLVSTTGNTIVHTPPDRYDVAVVKPVRLHDVDGTGSLRTRFDLRLADAAAPNLTSLRVHDAQGFNTATLPVDGGGTLLLSAIDSVLDVKTRVAVPGPIRTDSMRVQWRPHLANRWTPLTASLVAEDDGAGHPNAGAVYRADLAAVTQAGPGAIDLWIRFEDPSGNSYDWTLAPAFSVETPSRRPAARR